MRLKKPNRANKFKDMKSSGCSLCKPHKHGKAHSFKPKDRQLMVERILNE